MALKYFFEYRDDVNHLHRCEISNTAFVGTATEIAGKCIIEHPEVSDPLEAIRGLGMRIELEADLNLTLEDLFTDEERSYSVTHQVESVFLFTGFLKPDGVFQDFVNDKWVISLDCVDGLGLLENLSYVQSDGFPYLGKQKEIEIIANCLKRTGIQQNINTAINIFYTGFELDTDPGNRLDPIDVLRAVRLNSERFYKDDEKDTIMQCDEVLRSVLEKYCACITQQNGEWYIFRPSEVFSNATTTFYRYNFNGALLVPNTKTINLAKTIGSQIDNVYPHHVNANQRIEIEGSLGAYRINYKYGLVNSFFANTSLDHNGTVISDFTILSAPNIDLDPSGAGFIINRASNTKSAVVELIDDINVAVTDSLSFDIDILSTQNLDASYGVIRVTLFDGTTTYYLAKSGEWRTTETLMFFGASASKIRHTVKSQTYPVDGVVRFRVYTDSFFAETDSNTFSGDYQDVTYSGIRLYPNETSNILGEFHTVQRNDRPSSLIKDVKEIFNGDNAEDGYVGAIYKNDSITPTTTWNRVGKAETKPILQIMAEDTLRISANPSRVFSGDIYGYMPYLSAVTISGVTGLFMPLAYSYDTKSNIISLKLRQIFGAELADIDYELTFDYGKTVKPTIRG
jgi:hypothetical protein